MKIKMSLVLDDGMPDLPTAVLTKTETFLEKAKKYSTKLYRVFVSSAKSSDMFKSLTHFNHYREAKGMPLIEEYSLLPKEYQGKLTSYYRPFEGIRGNDVDKEAEADLLLKRKLSLTPKTLTIIDAMDFNPDLAPFFGKLSMKPIAEQSRVIETYAGDNLRFDVLRAMLKVNGGTI